MKQPTSTTGRRRLAPDAYRELRCQVLKRDNWHCQACGNMQNLHVHHMELRSQSGADSGENLITLCANCHFTFHRTSARKG